MDKRNETLSGWFVFSLGVLNVSGPSSGQYSGEPVDVPQNHKRAVCDLTVADRLALYNHVIGAVNQQKEASSNNEDLYVDLVSKLQRGESDSLTSTQETLPVPVKKGRGTFLLIQSHKLLQMISKMNQRLNWS